MKRAFSTRKYNAGRCALQHYDRCISRNRVTVSKPSGERDH